MNNDKINVAILGAGAMGCLYGAYLAENKAVRLTLLDHNADRIEAIRKNGLVMLEKNMQKVIRVDAEVSGNDLPSVDFLMLFVKAHQSYEALKRNTSLIGENTVVVSLQNGMGNYLEISKFLPLDRIVIGTSNHNSTIQGYGKFFHAADGATIIGGFTGENTSSPVNRVKQILSSSNLDVSISTDVKRIIWKKLFVNMAINPLTMLLEVNNGFVVKDQYSLACMKHVVHEGIAVASADGENFDEKEILDLIHKICQKTALGSSSMFQDRIHRHRTEIDFINGAVVRLASQYNIQTPYNTFLTHMVHAIEDTYIDTF